MFVHGIPVEDINDHVVKWVRRSANAVAHNLAKEGCVLGLNKVWFLFPPDCIKDVLSVDSPRV
jgi:hypothetical protein